MPYKTVISTLCLFFLLSSLTVATERDSVDLGHWSSTELTQIIAAQQMNTPAERIVALSRHFMGTPYTADTLVGDPQTAEQLVINLSGFDCFTFLDVIEAMRRATDLDDFPEQLKQVRYRGGLVTYENRRHFFSDWVAGDSARISDVTAAVGEKGSQVVSKQLNLKSDGTAWLPGLPVTERAITYIPTSNIDRAVLSALQAGDYVGLYSELDGLDVSHTGLIVQGVDGLLLRHASSRNSVQRVVDDDLLEYLDDKPGLVIYRAR
jgi:hypothetical protein